VLGGTEFQRSTSLLNSFLDRTAAEHTQLLDFGLADALEVPKTITVASFLRLPRVHNMVPNVGDLRVTAVENSTGQLKQKSGQTTPLGICQGFDDISPLPPQKL
jgi:hypothetical protein